MRLVGVLIMVLALSGCEALNDLTKHIGLESHRTCTPPDREGYSECTTVTVEKGVACIGSCLEKAKTKQ